MMLLASRANTLPCLKSEILVSFREVEGQLTLSKHLNKILMKSKSLLIYNLIYLKEK
jgi:hypothetical protein